MNLNENTDRKIEVYSYKGQRIPLWGKLLIALVLVGALTFCGLLGLVLHGSQDHVSGAPRTMLILGCKVESWGPSTLLTDRLDKALGYLEDHPDMQVVVSGGQGSDEPSTEARAMADYLMEHGVEEDRIFLEEESANTFENITLSKALMERENIDPGQGVLLVSNGFHLTRVRLLARRAGLEEISTLAAPSSHALSRLKMYIREPLALVKSALFDR